MLTHTSLVSIELKIRRNYKMKLTFKLTNESKVNLLGVTLFRIEAVVDIPARGVKKGEKGGWLESEKTSNGNARVSGDAWVYGNAEVYGNARVSGDAEVSGDARVSGDAWVSGNAEGYGNARVSGVAWVYGNAEVYGNARVSGDALNNGYCFAYKSNDWNVTEVPTKDGEGVLLVRDYTPPRKEDVETIEIEGNKYTVNEIKKALGK